MTTFMDKWGMDKWGMDKWGMDKWGAPRRKTQQTVECATRHPPETVGEMIANVATHGAGAVMSAVGLAVLVMLTVSAGATPVTMISMIIYGATLVLLYSASTLYHAVRGPRAREICRLMDHGAIFLLIAGTYTPFTLVGLGGQAGWVLFVVIWSIAISGILMRVMLRTRGAGFFVPLYLAMGWLMVIAAGDLTATVQHGMIWLAAGGVFYTAGLIFFAWRRLPYNHAVWHLFVLGGSACHFVAIAAYVLPVGT
ncbi:hemolysin III family protein [Fodinicurvata sp. EGI_FJ10296]|uniref:PAQR family membrane homeostasis protein TrhA n=1 Tax=Fodinicurvata sp. EGI_FJ10296 TaxID=3231908 RepID=UPI0034526015